MKSAWETAVARLAAGHLLCRWPNDHRLPDDNPDGGMDVKWTQMGTFARWGFWLGLAYPGISALIAFIDQSLGRAKKELEERQHDIEIVHKGQGQ